MSNFDIILLSHRPNPNPKSPLSSTIMPKTKTTENSLLLPSNTAQLHSSWVSVSPMNDKNDNVSLLSPGISYDN